MNALINPNQSIQYISSWDAPVAPSTNYTPVYSSVNEAVVEVSETTFEVASPLFWLACDASVTAYNYYYDPVTQAILPVPPYALKP